MFSSIITAIWDGVLRYRHSFKVSCLRTCGGWAWRKLLQYNTCIIALICGTWGVGWDFLRGSVELTWSVFLNCWLSWYKPWMLSIFISAVLVTEMEENQECLWWDRSGQPLQLQFIFTWVIHELVINAQITPCISITYTGDINHTVSVNYFEESRLSFLFVLYGWVHFKWISRTLINLIIDLSFIKYWCSVLQDSHMFVRRRKMFICITTAHFNVFRI